MWEEGKPKIVQEGGHPGINIDIGSRKGLTVWCFINSWRCVEWGDVKSDGRWMISP